MADGYVDKILSNPLSGKMLKVTMGQLQGATIVHFNATGNGTISYGGYQYEELTWMSLFLNFSIDMKPLNNTGFGSLINGSWTGMRGQLQRQEVDLAVSPFSGIGGMDIMDLSAYTRTDSHGILTQYPKPRSSVYGQVITFTPDVWLGVLLSMIACIVFIKLLDVVKNKFDRNDSSSGFSSLIDISEYVFATITNHGGYYKESHRSLGVMSATWCFATFVLVNAYCSVLTSYMSLLFQRPDINSLRDLVEHKHYHAVTIMGSTAERDPQSTGLIKAVGEKILKCPSNICRVANYDAGVKKVLENENLVSFITVLFAQHWMYKTFSDGDCRLTMNQYSMASTNYFMGSTKNSPYSLPLYTASLWYHSFGFGDYWVKKIMPGAPQCLLKYNNQGECVTVPDLAVFKLEQFYIAFGILLGGYVLAILQFLRERLIRY